MADIDLQAILKGTIAVHITGLFPKKRIIRTRFSTNPLKWFRDTVHFALNEPVQDLSALQTGGHAAVWSGKKFCILIPFDKLYAVHGKHLQSFSPEDTFFTKSVPLPEGTVILILPDGIPEAIENHVTTQEEVAGAFQNPPSEGFFQKDIGGIIYRFFNPAQAWNIVDVAKATIQELGYSLKFFHDKDIRKINELLGIKDFIAHNIHWTAWLEDFKIGIENHKHSIDYMRTLIVKLEEQGIVFPIIHERDGSLGDCFDAAGKRFNFMTQSHLSNDERRASEALAWSLFNEGNYPSRLQYPILMAIGMLQSQKTPSNYHNAIRFYLNDYRKYIREKLPKKVINSCAGLNDLLSATI